MSGTFSSHSIIKKNTIVNFFILHSIYAWLKSLYNIKTLLYENMNLYYNATALSFFRIKTWITSLLDIYGLKMENMQGVVGICI